MNKTAQTLLHVFADGRFLFLTAPKGNAHPNFTVGQVFKNSNIDSAERRVAVHVSSALLIFQQVEVSHHLEYSN